MALLPRCSGITAVLFLGIGWFTYFRLPTDFFTRSKRRMDARQCHNAGSLQISQDARCKKRTGSGPCFVDLLLKSAGQARSFYRPKVQLRTRYVPSRQAFKSTAEKPMPAACRWEHARGGFQVFGPTWEDISERRRRCTSTGMRLRSPLALLLYIDCDCLTMW